MLVFIFLVLFILTHIKFKLYESTQDKIFLYFFNSTCSTCIELDKDIKLLLEKLNKNGKVIYVSTEEPSSTEIINRYNLTYVPAIIVTDQYFNELLRFDKINEKEQLDEIYKIIKENKKTSS